MNGKALLLLLAPALGSLLFGGCSDPADLDRHPADRLTMSVTISPDELGMTDTLRVSVAARNPTSRRVEFTSNSCLFFIDMWAVEGEHARSFPGACFDLLVWHRVEPGESLKSTLDVPMRYWHGPSQEFRSMPPGAYEVYVGITTERRNQAGPFPFRVVPEG